MQNALAQVGVDDLSLDRELIRSAQHSFSNVIDTGKVTNQKKSGRCWIFAALNMLRHLGGRAKYGDDFEFSQNYVYFWDKFERFNWFMEEVIKTAQLPLDDRTVSFLLESSNLGSDGGQWDMFVGVVLKHGLVPKAAMPETESSSNSHRMNAILRTKLRQAALDLRKVAPQPRPSQPRPSQPRPSQPRPSQPRPSQPRPSHLLAPAATLLPTSMLCMHLGTPPARFEYQWTDKDKEKTFHRIVRTPRPHTPFPNPSGHLSRPGWRAPGPATPCACLGMPGCASTGLGCGAAWRRRMRAGGQEAVSPLDFLAASVSVPLGDYVCLIHDPRPASLLHRAYTVAHLGSVVGSAHPVRYLTVSLEELKELTMRTIVDRVRAPTHSAPPCPPAGRSSGGTTTAGVAAIAPAGVTLSFVPALIPSALRSVGLLSVGPQKEPVWFGSDVGKSSRTKDYGLLAAGIFGYGALYQTGLGLPKADQLLTGQMAMTHAMLITGVDVAEGRPRRWRVENSWGEDHGSKGYLTMTDPWFDEYVMEVAIRRDLLSTPLQEALGPSHRPGPGAPPWCPGPALAANLHPASPPSSPALPCPGRWSGGGAAQEPLVLPPWDPYGTLAQTAPAS
ncbi:putative Bleomycin hydrolase [Paratrimastix pyriformis]|uniref:bleomycin hydrolase n=1 Tax=Paratrimastix pyriformis TaxID=342808 RepID=A0ABQ8UWC1_9EUKA|nr:putative Bleomycin hydrolase [Paratrimastix pyriformis]